MADTTSLDDLPINPAIDMGQGNVQLAVAENVKINNANSEIDMRRMEEERRQLVTQVNNSQPNMGSNEMNQFISGLQQASAKGMLNMPSRDIPQISSQVAMDTQARSDYVPQASNHDYIGQTMSNDEIIKYHQNKQRQENTVDVMYEELQTPILISILFFIFQLPLIRKQLFKFFPSLLKSDGNPSLGGYLYSSLLFGTGYYVLNKIMKHFSEI